MRNLTLVALMMMGCSHGESILSCPDDLEPNGSQAEARRLTPGTSASGLKACNGDEDWYVVALGMGEVLELALDSKKSEALARPVDLLRALVHEPTQGATIAKMRASDDGFSLRTDLQPGDAGDYYVHIKHSGEGLVEYDLTAMVTPPTQACPAGQHPQSGACVADGCSDLGFEVNDDVAHARSL